MKSPLTVAVLGTGIMGSAMARNIARAGHDVRTWNRSAEKAAALASDGISPCASPAEAVDGADVVLTMLYDAKAVTEVISQAAPSLRPGTLWIQSTTVGATDARALAELAAQHGAVFFDAPVSGTREPAEAGQLLVIAAGPTQQRPVASQVFDAIGARTLWTGEDGAAGSATRLKLVVNSWVIAASNAAGEIVSLAHALQVPPQQFFDLIAGGGLDLPFLRMKANLVLGDRMSPASFAVDTSGKDAHLILDAARAAGIRLDGMEAFSARLDRVASRGFSKYDMAAAYLASLPESDHETPQNS